MNYYKLLDVNAISSVLEINSRCDALIASTPQDGFSAEALETRSQIIETARYYLTDRSNRTAYDEGLRKEATIEIPFAQLPGALALLQEIGEVETVLQTGNAFLRDRDSRYLRGDAALAMALAYCDLSRDAMAEDPPRIAQGCELLETALKMLQEEGGQTLAPELQFEIDQTLEVSPI